MHITVRAIVALALETDYAAIATNRAFDNNSCHCIILLKT